MTERSGERRVVIVGAGITGLACAHRILRGDPSIAVTVLEASGHTGGLIRTSPFAGHAHVDEAADAFLLRNPAARRLADEIGLSGLLTSPANGHASVWHGRLHRLPENLLLGVPTNVLSLARSRLISPLGKMRAALEPLLPRTALDDDCLGRLIRRRFGNEVHERLVDPLVGSIYAADTDDFSLQGMPQLYELALEGRSLLLSARRRPKAPPVSPDNPVFAAPVAGMQALTDAVHSEVVRLGGVVHTGRTVRSITKSTGGLSVHCDGVAALDADHVVLCSPARSTGAWLTESAPQAGRLLTSWQHASVVMVALAFPRRAMPKTATGSGYLVPKPDQRFVTAVSFASQKWAHLDDGEHAVLRVSLGRDGMPLHQHSDEELLSFALADLKMHLDIDITPRDVRLTRWVDSFPQYRPGHFERVVHVERHLADELPNVHLAGASYRGIGVPACVQQANTVAERILTQRG